MSKPLHSSLDSAGVEPSIRHSSTPVLRPRIQSTELFGAIREIVIEHAGEEYRLRLTRQVSRVNYPDRTGDNYSVRL